MPTPSEATDAALANERAFARAAAIDRDTLAATVQEQAAALAALRRKVADLEATAGAAIPVWRKGMTIEAGGTYRCPDGAGISIRVKAKRVTFIGGHVWPENGPAFDVEEGADDFTSIGTRFHHPNPPVKVEDGRTKRDVPPCVFSRARNTSVIRPDVGTIGEFVKLWPGADGTLVARVVATADVYSALVGCWGADNTAVVFCTAPDSVTENLVRFSPQGDKIPQGALIAYCDLGNPGNKSTADLRHLNWGVVFRSRLTVSPEDAAVGIGNAKPDAHGARNIYVLNNTIPSGSIKAYEATDKLTVDGNVFLYADKPVNNAISGNAVPGVLKEFRAVGNRIVSPVEQKPVVAFHQGVKPAVLEERDNVRVEP